MKKPVALAEYLNDCSNLKVDLDLLLEDVQSVEEVRYAIDFSEIRAFCRPDVARGFRLFRDDDDSVTRELEQVALGRIFRAAEKSPLLLLSPYVVELQGYVDDLRRRSVAELATSVVDALSQLEELASAPEFRAIEGFAHGMAAVGYEATDALTFLERKAGALLMLLERTEVDPVRRLNRLFSSRLLVKLSRVLGHNVEPNESATVAWLAALKELRMARGVPEETNRLDAVAMGILETVNTDPNIPFMVALISRSGTMQEVATTLGSRPFLRHPRTFVAFAELDDLEAVRRERELGTMRDSLDAFLSVVSGLKADNAEHINAKAMERLAMIKREWHAAARLGMGMSQVESVSHKHAVQNRVVEVLRLLQDKNELRELVRTRVRELSDEIERNHHLLAVLLQDEAEAESTIGEQVFAERGASATLNLLATHAMPYALEFYSESMRSWSAEFEKERHVSWSELLGLIANALDAGAEYESVLAVAYLFAAMNRWAIAEKYAQLSIAYARGDELAHEGKFLLSVCLRKRAPTFTRYMAAYDLLGSAMEAKQTRRNDSSYEDPRFLKEKAALIFLWNRHCSENAPDAAGFCIAPPLDEAIALSERALHHPEADWALRVQLCNNLLYRSLEDSDAQHEAILNYYNQLLELLSDRERETLPPLVRDTLALARWRISSWTGDLSEADSVLVELNTVMQSRDLTSLDLRRVSRHRWEVQNALEGRPHVGNVNDSYVPESEV